MLPWHRREHVCANAASMQAHTKRSTQWFDKKRPGVQKEENVCFPNQSLLAPTAVRPVWKHEWAACKSIRTRGLVSSKSSADWHVLHVISCIVLRGERLSLSDWLVKGCFAVVHVCVRGGEHMAHCKRCGLPLLLCQRLDYVQHYPPPYLLPNTHSTLQ